MPLVNQQRRKPFGLHWLLGIFLLVTASLAMVSGGAPGVANASIYAGSNSGWLMIASKTNQGDAIALARRYSRKFPSAVVFQSSNGYYGVSLGWTSRKAGKRAISVLSGQGVIASDSYIHSGERWVRAVWSASNTHNSSRRALLGATKIVAPGNYNPNPQPTPEPTPPPQPNIVDMAPTPAKVVGLKTTGDNYLSLRQGPSTKHAELARMRPATTMTITGRTPKWYRVRLSNGMAGFAYRKYVKIAKVPLIGPEEHASNDVPTVGPDEEPVKPEKPQEHASKEPDVVKNPPSDGKAITDQKRVALVLGNSEYEHTSALANPKNDADAVSTSLENLGFTVIKGLDLDKVGMEKAVREFVKILPGSDVALFFYAGHAMQVDGKNFLIPVNAELEDSTAIDFETINLGVVLSFMNDRDRTSIALLDACRNNPLARNFTRKIGKTRSSFVGRGLAAPNAGDGQMLIGFATAPGEVALDGDGDNSPFTTALLKHIATPGVEIELMLKRVKSDVFDNTEGSQSPWHNSALRKEFFFAK